MDTWGFINSWGIFNVVSPPTRIKEEVTRDQPGNTDQNKSFFIPDTSEFFIQFRRTLRLEDLFWLPLIASRSAAGSTLDLDD